MKQCCRDLYVINYRLQGLVAQICKTQKIVLANREKFRVRSEKYQGGAGLKRCNRSRGFSANFRTHRKNRKITSFSRDWTAKPQAPPWLSYGSLPLAKIAAI
jgi:hypothetical protein